MRSVRGTSFASLSQAVVIDVETTGLSPSRDRIVAVGAIRADFDALLSDQEAELPNYYGLFDPERSIPTEASNIHGIFDFDVEGEGNFAENAEMLLEFLEGLPIVAHNCEFDAGFLSREFERAGFKHAIERPLYCTMKRACHYVSRKGKNRTRISLEDACSEFRVPFYRGGYHDAMEDAVAVTKLAGTLVAYDREATKKVKRNKWTGY
ncbi:3'-5' exonuclease [Martelella lutilitoris]|uniref:3'-5' exonuclease n=1 Tax=Martelella lutilitoris TaxID=2583532 RepID=A0A7T7HMF6_9HYPH|nr:3'-5' exonuclease [Martelella lutilitoris]QQM31852.1 3'-5' exonuclease [Martelella lutilitoris]